RKKRAWDGERMHYAEDDTLRVEIDLDGSFTATYKNGRCIDSHKIVLMDAIGVEDDEGREIYEGDFLERGGSRYQVAWQQAGYWGFALLGLDHVTDYDSLMSNRPFGVGVVVGNIYENPDMEEI